MDSFIMQYNNYPFNIIFKDENKKISDTKLIDFFNLMALIFYKDITTERNEKKLTSKETELKLKVEVFNLNLFCSLKDKIEELLKFVTSENWDIEFVEIEKENIEKYDFVEKRTLFSIYDKIALCSGGLDSFSGTFYNKDQNVLYVGFKNNNLEVSKQEKIQKFLFENRKSKFELVELPKRKKKHLTQRSRSLFFFSIGVIFAYLNKVNIVEIYENGVLSLNPTINHNLRTTKTTHPKTIYIFNLLLEKIGSTIRINHKFIFTTKGEMVKNLNEEFLVMIKNTVTCGRSRKSSKFGNNEKSKHCGACIPCLLRKITMASNDFEKYDVEYVVPYNHSLKSDSEFQDDYITSINHFYNIKKSIDDGAIFSYIHLKKIYYTDPAWREKTKKMLQKFSNEIDYFFKKYGIL